MSPQSTENWYYVKFREYDFQTQYLEKSNALRETHQERKVQSIVEDLDEMEEDIEKHAELQFKLQALEPAIVYLGLGNINLLIQGCIQ